MQLLDPHINSFDGGIPSFLLLCSASREPSTPAEYNDLHWSLYISGGSDREKENRLVVPKLIDRGTSVQPACPSIEVHPVPDEFQSIYS